MNCPKCNLPIERVKACDPNGGLVYACYACGWGCERVTGQPIRQIKVESWDGVPPATGTQLLLAWSATVTIVVGPWVLVTLFFADLFNREFLGTFNHFYPLAAFLYLLLCATFRPEAFSYTLGIADRPFEHTPDSIPVYNKFVFLWSLFSFPGILCCYAIYSTGKLFRPVRTNSPH